MQLANKKSTAMLPGKTIEKAKIPWIIGDRSSTGIVAITEIMNLFLKFDAIVMVFPFPDFP